MEVLQLMCGLISGFVAAYDVRFQDTEKTYQSTCICYSAYPDFMALSEVMSEGTERHVGLCFSRFALRAECSLPYRMLQPREPWHRLKQGPSNQELVWSSFLVASRTARMRTVTTANMIDTYCPRVLQAFSHLGCELLLIWNIMIPIV